MGTEDSLYPSQLDLMKKTTIISIVCIVAAIAILLSASSDVSTYATFESAKQAGSKVKINGTLDLTKDMVYDPNKDANYFSFYMEDTDGELNQVILTMPKPQDFERAESVVVTGKMKDNVFVATEVLTKCPSKYKNEELLLSGELDG
jgi:cytochrome c-type biogenesis protein CcmE